MCPEPLSWEGFSLLGSANPCGQSEPLPASTLFLAAPCRQQRFYPPEQIPGNVAELCRLCRPCCLQNPVIGQFCDRQATGRFLRHQLWPARACLLLALAMSQTRHHKVTGGSHLAQLHSIAPSLRNTVPCQPAYWSHPGETSRYLSRFRLETRPERFPRIRSEGAMAELAA